MAKNKFKRANPGCGCECKALPPPIPACGACTDATRPDAFDIEIPELKAIPAEWNLGNSCGDCTIQGLGGTYQVPLIPEDGTPGPNGTCVYRSSFDNPTACIPYSDFWIEMRLTYWGQVDTSVQFLFGFSDDRWPLVSNQFTFPSDVTLWDVPGFLFEGQAIWWRSTGGGNALPDDEAYLFDKDCSVPMTFTIGGAQRMWFARRGELFGTRNDYCAWLGNDQITITPVP